MRTSYFFLPLATGPHKYTHHSAKYSRENYYFTNEAFLRQSSIIFILLKMPTTAYLRIDLVNMYDRVGCPDKGLFLLNNYI